MDPTAALESILHGHMVLDHVEALRDWLRGGGFAPEPRFIPVDCDPMFGRFRKDRDITADWNIGLYMTDKLGRKRVLMYWSDIVASVKVRDELTTW